MGCWTKFQFGANESYFSGSIEMIQPWIGIKTGKQFRLYKGTSSAEGCPCLGKKGSQGQNKARVQKVSVMAARASRIQG